ncbi:MAG: geranylgeranylglycerol-phosphate geranylgeranyltransferase [Bacteroidetes bacterium]|nr:geranylgeranylglycerol-phosphate geranylgeranyltransferase [Bacteroidota bacterium]
MFAYTRLVRLPNLLIIAVSQALVRYCLVIPAFQTEYNNTGIFPSHLGKIEFVLLVLSTVLIAAAGNIINDVFDVHMDEINKPGKNVIGKMISVGAAKMLFYIFSAAGVIIGFYLSLKIDKPVMGCIPLFAAGSLWMYASYYKKRFLIGNFIVALLSSLSLLLVGLYEPAFYPNLEYLLVYVVFALALSLIREIIKDMEDVDGDERAQCKSLPIIAGIKTTKYILVFLIIVTATLMAYILSKYFYGNKVINFWNLLAIFEIPLVALSYLVVSAEEKKDYHFASTFVKIIMVLGIFSLLPFYYYFLR